jgi:hypothetical protein
MAAEAVPAMGGDRYVKEAKVGEGTYAVVFRARDTYVGQRATGGCVCRMHAL